MKYQPALNGGITFPPPSNDCRRVRLAESSVAAVDQCDCGMMQLHLAALTLRLTPDSLSELLATLGMAVARRAAHSAHGDSVPMAMPEPGHA